MASSEDEIYSIMFTSLKHPARRKVLRMLAEKPMTFSELVEHLGVSSSHLTYHLESLGELISKLDNGQYKLSTFGEATVSAMRGVEEVPNIESKQRLKVPFKWKALLGILLVSILALSSMTTIQFFSLNQLIEGYETMKIENEQLLSWGVGTSKIASLLNDVIQIDLTQYKITLLSNNIEYRSDFDASEEVLRYSLTSIESNLDAIFRFRNNHLSRYQLNPIESSPIYTHPQSNDLLEMAKSILERYKDYSGDAYLDEMLSLLVTLNSTANIEVTQDNLKLRVTVSGGNGEFLWLYTEDGIDFAAKSLKMVFENRFLKEMTDGYYLFTVGHTSLDISENEAVEIAKSYTKTLTWTIDGKQVSGFVPLEEPISAELVPHPRAGSIGLIPYWYIVLRLDKVYSGDIDRITVGIYADTGQVANVQMLSG